MLETPPETIRHEMETNFFGTLLVTRAFAPDLIANAPGAILNVASVLSWLHPIALGTYSCRKRRCGHRRMLSVTNSEESFGSTVAIFGLPRSTPTLEIVQAAEPVAHDSHEQLCL